MNTNVPAPSYRAHVACLASVWIALTCLQWTTTLALDERAHCYRAWECVVARGKDHPFVPHATYDALSSGDLGHMVGLHRLQRHRRERFTTDEYGFRNPVGSLGHGADIVVVGDSFAAGSYLSDDEILSGLLRTGLDRGVYNYAPAPFADYFRDPRFSQRPPQWVVLLQIERNLRAERFPPIRERPALRLPRWSSTQHYRDARPNHHPVRTKVQRLRSELERSHYFEALLEPHYKGLLDILGLYRFPPTIAHHDPESGFLFYADGVSPKLKPKRERRQVAAAVIEIARYARALEQRGTRLLVAVAPDKSTLYRDRVPSLAGEGLGGALAFAQTEMTEAGIDHIDLLALFERDRAAHPTRDLYFADDTHMNARANWLTYQAVAERIRRGAR